MLMRAENAAEKGDFREAHSTAIDAADLLDYLVPALGLAADDQVDKLKERMPEVKPDKKKSEPVGSLKYGTPPPRAGGLGYRGSRHSHREEWPDDNGKPLYDDAPPAPIKAEKRRVIITPPPVIETPEVRKKPEAPKPAPIPEGAEVVTLDIDKLSTGTLGAHELDQLLVFDSFDQEFRSKVLKTHSTTRRPVTIWRQADGEWRIR
jgi:hypothetical protein